MRRFLIPIALCAALTACETSSYDEESVGYEPPRPAPELEAPATSADPYVLSADEAAQWAEEDISEDNADAALDDLESEILGDG